MALREQYGSFAVHPRCPSCCQHEGLRLRIRNVNNYQHGVGVTYSSSCDTCTASNSSSDHDNSRHTCTSDASASSNNYYYYNHYGCPDDNYWGPTNSSSYHNPRADNDSSPTNAGTTSNSGSTPDTSPSNHHKCPTNTCPDHDIGAANASTDHWNSSNSRPNNECCLELQPRGGSQWN